MLVLTRKIDEEIKIGSNVTLRILSISENQIKIGIEAPRDVQVYRAEVYDKVKECTQMASRASSQKQMNLSEYKIKKVK